jgi:putative transposase
VYLKGYATMGELTVGLTEYFAFYNGERPHQSLGDQTPQLVYQTAIGGGAMIVDKFGGAGEKPLFRYAPQGFLPRRSKINSHSTNQSKGKTGAAPSSCY